MDCGGEDCAGQRVRHDLLSRTSGLEAIYARTRIYNHAHDENDKGAHMIVSIKPGVRVRGLSNEILLAIMIAESVYRETEQSMVVTSLTDGKHSANSRHYTGDAVDLRLPMPTTKLQIVSRLIAALGVDYDVVLENDHIHIEYDPKR